MSVKPKNYTHTTVQDLDFIRKYNLTPTQSSVMSYLRNLPSWSINVGDGFHLLTTSKINLDLLFNEKTIAGAITKLKKLNLIETKMVIHSDWSDFKKFRAIKLTILGMKYSLDFARPKENTIIVNLKKEVEDLSIKTNALNETNRNLQDEILELKSQLAKSQEEVEKICKLPPENQEKNDSSISRGNNSLMQEVNKDFITFKIITSKRFANSNLPICNAVPGWNFKTEFMINSYNKLSIITPDEKYKQLVNPKEINRFWQWLFKNQERVGEIKENEILIEKNEAWKSLLLFIGFFVVVNDEKYQIYTVKKAENGVKIQIKSEAGQIAKIQQNKNEILELNWCKTWLQKNSFRE